MTGDGPNDWPLIGRDAELGQVARLLRGERNGGVALLGPGGVGKTRLANECLRMAEKRGFSVVRVMATRAASGIGLAALAPLLPVASASGDLLASARDSLLTRASGERLVLLADDAQLLDETSAELLHDLVVERALFLLATIRTPSDLPPPIAELCDGDHLAPLEIGPLADADVDELITQTLGPNAMGLASHELRRLCRGNPLTLRELILSLRESGALTGDGRERLELVGPLRVSDRLADLVESRLSSLDADESSVVEFVALGEPMELPLLERLSNRSTIESCERKGIIALREDEGGRHAAWLDHPLFGEVLRANVGAIRTRNVLRSMADALEASGVDSPSDLIRLAVWRLESGSRADEQLLLAAAQEAWARQSYNLANQICTAVWQSDKSFETGHVLASTLGDLGRFAEAEVILDEIAALDRSDDVRSSVVVVRTEHLFRAGRATEAIAKVRDALRDTTDPRWTAIFEAHLSTLLLLHGDVRGATELARRVPDDESLEAVNTAALVIGTALTWDGRPLDALTIHEETYEACSSAARLDDASLALLNNVNIQVVGMIQALTQAGRLREADELLAVAWQRASADHAPVPMAWTALMYALQRTQCGLPGDALQWADVSTGVWRSSGVAARMRWSQGVAASSLAILGRPAEAAASMREIDDLDRTVRFNEAYVDDAQAWTLAAALDFEGARAMCVAAAAKGVEMGQRTCSAIALHSLARMGAPARAAKLFEELRDDLQGELHHARVEHVDALAANDPQRLASVSERFETIGAMLLAAESSADAVRAFRDTRRSGKAQAELKRVATLVERCQGARTPALQAVESAPSLTRREREVVTLAARGLTSKKIAERLDLSIRTVENHLSHAFQKLQVTSREDLASLPEFADD